MVIYLDQMSPPGSSDLPESRRAALCFLFGLASDGVYICPVCYQPGGSLLRCLSTLTGSKAPAVYFCCTVPGVASARRYLASCPVKPGLSSPAAFRLCGSDHLFYLNGSILSQILSSVQKRFEKSPFFFLYIQRFKKAIC